MAKYSMVKISTRSLMVASLVFLGACQPLWQGAESKKSDASPSTSSAATSAVNDGSTVLCSVDGKARITENTFNSSLAQMLQQNPYFRGAGPDALPANVKRKFFDELIKQELIVAKGEKDGIEKREDFIKAYDEMCKLVKQSLIVRFFEKDVFDTITVSDDQIKSHFNENKSRYVKVPGGVAVLGAKFDKEELATAFLSKVKANPDQFETLAKADKQAKFRDFGRVSKEAQQNNQYGFESTPAPIKESALALSSLPACEKVKVGKEFWVIKAADRKEPEHYQLEEIRAQLDGMLKQNAFREKVEAKLKDLRGQFTVNVNESFFKNAEKQEAARGGQSEVDGEAAGMELEEAADELSQSA